MLKLELQEGESSNKNKKYAKDFPFHVAVTVRLFKDWFHTGRCGMADSAFASLLCAEELLKRGRHFQAIVKAATRRFPKAFLTKWTNEPQRRRGDQKALKTSVVAGTDDQGNDIKKLFMLLLGKIKLGKPSLQLVVLLPKASRM